MSETAPHIVVEVSSAPLTIGADWRALTGRAATNVFMDPLAINVVHAKNFASTCVLIAWDKTTDVAKLVGVWALRRTKASPAGPSILAAPPYDYSFLSNPVVDPAVMDEVVQAFFAAIADDPALPKVIRLRYLDGSSASYPAILKAVSGRGGHRLILDQRERAFAAGDASVKRSGATRKKLRQDWNRLSAEGSVAVVNDRSPTAVREAFEAFLALEAASWKSDRGTAILSNDKTADFARTLIGDLANAGGASVALLTLDGKPIAAQVLLYSGAMAYTWKTAFDPRHGKYSPGALLVDKVTEALFAGGDIEAIESCSPDGGFMAQMWSGRRSTVDLLVDLGKHKSFAFTVVSLEARGYAELKAARDRLRLWWSSWRKRRRLATAGTP